MRPSQRGPCADEHVARTRAEGELENATRRLAVAQEQIAEFANERSKEAAQLLAKTSALHGMLQGVPGDHAQLAQVPPGVLCWPSCLGGLQNACWRAAALMGGLRVPADSCP